MKISREKLYTVQKNSLLGQMDHDQLCSTPTDDLSSTRHCFNLRRYFLMSTSTPGGHVPIIFFIAACFVLFRDGIRKIKMTDVCSAKAEQEKK
jgi:hypothetical protein